jgi:hypothetical protein
MRNRIGERWRTRMSVRVLGGALTGEENLAEWGTRMFTGRAQEMQKEVPSCGSRCEPIRFGRSRIADSLSRSPLTESALRRAENAKKSFHDEGHEGPRRSFVAPSGPFDWSAAVALQRNARALPFRETPGQDGKACGRDCALTLHRIINSAQTKIPTLSHRTRRGWGNRRDKPSDARAPVRGLLCRP